MAVKAKKCMGLSAEALLAAAVPLQAALLERHPQLSPEGCACMACDHALSLVAEVASRAEEEKAEKAPAKAHHHGKE